MSDPGSEVRHELTVTPTMQLVDINGTIASFQADITIECPSAIQVAIASQDQLDQGTMRWESVSGTSTKRISRPEPAQQNHFVALKKLDKDDSPISATLVIRTVPIPPIHPPPATPSATPSATSPLTSNVAPEVRTRITQELSRLPQQSQYINAPSSSASDASPPAKKESPPVAPSFLFRNPYYIVAIICLVACLLILGRRR